MDPSHNRTALVAAGKLKEWSLVLYGTSVHPYILRSEKPRSAEIMTHTNEEFTEEYNGTCPPPSQSADVLSEKHVLAGAGEKPVKS